MLWGYNTWGNIGALFVITYMMKMRRYTFESLDNWRCRFVILPRLHSYICLKKGRT